MMDLVHEVVERLAGLERILAGEYGKPIAEIAPHDPRIAPMIGRITLAAGPVSRDVDFRALLGKPATRGHLSNIGGEAVNLVFVTLNPTSGANVETAPYLLPGWATLDLCHYVDIARFNFGPLGGDVQWLVQ